MPKPSVLDKKPAILEMKKVLLPEGSDKYLFDTRVRCDTGGCGAQAYVRTTFNSGNELYWCMHHARQAEPGLTRLVSEWYSEENRLTQNKLKGNENS